MQFDAKQIGHILGELWTERQPLIARLRIRRQLINLASNAPDDYLTGTWLPEAYADSNLVLRTLIGDVTDVIDNYTSRIGANEPQIAVVPRSVQNKVSKQTERFAGEQERMLTAMWGSAGGRAAQRRAAYSQAWGRAGWYLTLPRDASWGLPDRKYFTDLSDDEIERMNIAGEITIDGDTIKESGESWMARRKDAAQEQALSGTSLFTLEEFPPDMVLPRYDHDGTARHSLKYGFVIEELPASDFQPGSDLARSAARVAGVKDEAEIDRFGIFLDDDGDIVGGVTAGAEQDSYITSDRWTLARFVTREEVYYYVCKSPQSSSGLIVHHEEHGAGIVPLIPVPARITDGGAPGAEFSSPMESVFAQTPLINQLETMLSNVATWNALGRFYIVQPDGVPLTDDEGNLITMTQEDLIGGDPGQVYVTKGEVRQLTIDADFMQSLLGMYLERYDQSKPSPVTEGAAGASAAAWQVNQLLETSNDLIKEPVDNHAEAVRRVQQLWIRWLRMLDEPIYVVPAPGQRRNPRTVRGLIEFKPENLTAGILVTQSPQSAQQRIVLRQAGLELLQAGRIDEHTFYEEYDLNPDPEEAIIRSWSQRALDILMLGNTDQVDPDSVLAEVTRAARGLISMEMLRRSPAFALAQAEQMAQNVQLSMNPQLTAPQESTADAAGRGNVTETAGIRRPGIGMGLDIPSSPGARAPR